MRLPWIAATALFITLALSACGPGTPTPTKTPSPGPGTASATPTPTPTAEPAPGPAPFAATCENLLSTSLAEYSGYGISGPGPYADKLHSEGNAFAGFYDAGGVFCFVGQSEAMALFGWAPFDDDSWAPIRAANLSEGWSEEVTDAGFLMRSPYPQPLMVCYYRPGVYGACAVSDAVLDEIIANGTA